MSVLRVYVVERLMLVHAFRREVVMQDTNRMADQANRMAQQAQERFQTGLEAAGKSFAEANKNFQALAAEIMNYSKTAFDDAMRTWEQLISVKSLDQAMQIQSDYARRVYENHMAELSKLGEITTGMVRDSSKPVEEAIKRST